jgi:hypothetical protein
MQPFQSTPRPTHTPWGNADEAEQIAPGIWRVSTPSHGGFILSAERRAAMPAYLRAIPTFAGGPNYEEDCDWSIVAMSFPEEFSHAVRVAAIRTFNGWIAPKIGERKSSRGQQALGGV